ncbi:mechanosensitive ion channel family protein [Lysinibacillus sp. MHQ-1]|nr:mechanosensitive ion channel family protein [Lysinibacillus sp. MHQ-1]
MLSRASLLFFEDQFGVGDYIKINGAEGTVVEIGLRTTKINGGGRESNLSFLMVQLVRSSITLLTTPKFL